MFHNVRAFLILAVMMLVFNAVAGERPDNARPDDDLLRMLEVHVGQNVLDDVLLTYEENGMVLLPLGSLCQMLGIAVTTDPGVGIASGFILRTDRRFALDFDRGEVTLSGTVLKFAKARMRVYPDDLYVDARLLEQWFPMTFDIDLYALQIRVLSREPLPFQQRLLRRQRIAAQQAGRSGNKPHLPRQTLSYSAYSVPFIDLDIRSGFKKIAPGILQSSSSYHIHANGDLAYLESNLFVADKGDGSRQVRRLTLGRSDPDGKLLGPLRATRFRIGDISSPGQELIGADSRARPGILLTNRPLHQPDHYDSHSFRGELPNDWDVELYRNNVLIGYQSSQTDGRYQFDDIPLLYGNNSFRLAFYGPHGEYHEEYRYFTLNQQMIRPGRHHYQLLLQRDTSEAAVQSFDYAYGMNKHWSGHFLWMQTNIGGRDHDYHSLGLRGFGNGWFGSFERVTAIRGGHAFGLKFRSHLETLNIGLTHHRFERAFVSLSNPADPDKHLQRSSAIQLNTRLASPWISALPVSLGLTHDRFSSGKMRQSIEQRISVQRGRWLVSNSLRKQSDSAANGLDGEALFNIRVLGLDSHARIRYQTGHRARVDSADISLSAKSSRYWSKLSWRHTFADENNKLQFELTRQFRHFSFGFSLDADSIGQRRLLLNWRGSMGLEPRHHRLLQSRLPMASMGNASIRAFLDNNRDGVFNGDDSPLQGVTFDVGHHRYEGKNDTSDKNGISLLTGLVPYQPTNIRITTASLENPDWIPAPAGVEIIPRPGKTATIDLPVTISGEIDGTVDIEHSGKRKNVSNVELELVDSTGEIIKRVKTAYDGFFLISGVPIDDYQLRVGRQQLKRFGITPPPPRQIHLTPSHPIMSGMDFVLRVMDTNRPGSQN